MKKKKAATALSLAQFRVRFLRHLASYHRADPLIARILQDQKLKEHCATLLWLTENDARDQIARQSAGERKALEERHASAIRGLQDAEFLYRKFYNKPLLAENLSALRGDLLSKQRAVKVAFAPPKAYGRDRDWSIVRYAKDALGALLKTSIPNRLMADLLNAADSVVGRKFARKKLIVEEGDVEMALRHLHQSTFERILPYYQQLLAEHYPRGDAFTLPNKTLHK